MTKLLQLCDKVIYQNRYKARPTTFIDPYWVRLLLKGDSDDMHWADKALRQMESNARRFEHNAQSYFDLARKSPRIAVGLDGIDHPRRRYNNIANTQKRIAEAIREDMEIVERHRPT